VPELAKVPDLAPHTPCLLPTILNEGICPVQANDPNEFDLRLALISLTAKGKVALYLVVPLSLLLLAVA
jgi:hypothetical protein